jgi:predicted amidohydrolase YtcJ
MLVSEDFFSTGPRERFDKEHSSKPFAAHEQDFHRLLMRTRAPRAGLLAPAIATPCARLAPVFACEGVSINMRSISKMLAVALAALALAVPGRAQSADTVLLNGKILTVDAQFSTREALAIREGRITAVGTTGDIRKLAGPATQVIDLGGRTVIPGLIDNHMHAIRAALSFSTEVNWIGATSLAEALGRLHDAAYRMKPGAWLIVVTPPATTDAFKEHRRPTQAELIAAAPNNPVYVQLGYGWAMMTPRAFDALKIAGEADLPRGAKLETDASGKPTGVITGGMNNIVELFDRLPKPSFDEQVEGTKQFFRELNRLGLTGVVDPGGNNMTPESYQAVFKVWRGGELTLRIAYMLCGMTPGHEFEDYKNYLAMMPMGFGDDMLRFNGIGERVTWAMNALSGQASQADLERYYEIVRWAAQHNYGLTMHWDHDGNVDQLLRVFERVNKEFPLANLRWTIAHLNDASTATFQRMKALGVGWTMQDMMYNDGDQVVKEEGAEAARRMPPVMTAEKLGIVVNAGTDAHRVSTYNPFTVLQWLQDGKTASGHALRGAEETPSRADALRFYTIGSAWVAHDEARRGSLEAGKFADLAVLNTDYMTKPVDQIGKNFSLLTMVGGKIVYAAGPYAQFESKENPTGGSVASRTR